MELIRSGGSHDADLRSRPLPVLGAVSIFHHHKFAHRIHAKHLAANASRRVVNFRRTGELDAVQQEKILLWTAPGRGKHVPHDGV